MRYLITDLINGHTVTIDTLELTAEETVEAVTDGLLFFDDDAHTLVRDLLAGRPHSEHAAALSVIVTQLEDLTPMPRPARPPHLPSTATPSSSSSSPPQSTSPTWGVAA